MLNELFQEIIKLGQQSALPKIIRHNEEPAHHYFLARPGGQITEHVTEPPTRNHMAGDLSAVAGWVVATWPNEKGEEYNIAELPVVWFSRNAVTLFLDDSNRRNRITLKLSLHPQLKDLQTLEHSQTWHDQKSFVRLLRVKLAGCLQPENNALETFRRIRFKKVDEGSIAILHTKSSIGRQIEAEIAGASIIPEELLLMVPVFEGPLSEHSFPIRCAVETDPAKEAFQLIPFPGEIEKAICAAEKKIGRLLRGDMGEEIPIYYGTP